MVEAELEDLSGAPDLPCAVCGHLDSEHEEQESEEAGITRRRYYCTACEAFHDFVPEPSDL